MCDCWICRYADRPFLMGDCPHPHFSHPGDGEEKSAYLESEEYRVNREAQKKRPRYVLTNGFFGAKLVHDDGREEDVG